MNTLAASSAPDIRETHNTSSARRAARKPTNGATAMNWLVVRAATLNNLKNIDAHIPLGRFVCVTGVSGSGKSSLVNDILYEQLARDLNAAESTHPGQHRAIEGKQHLDKIIAIDQSPIGRTPRSNPATYIKLFDEIRDLYAGLPDAKVRGYKPGRFSFNVKSNGDLAGSAAAGRCEACEGNGSNRIEMDFLADVWVTCPVCAGKRFNRETLQVLFKGRSIAEVLDMDVQQALDHFANIPKIAGMLRTLHDVGLDYLKLGQASTTLSGGEAQRIKLARELVKRSTGRTLYLLDEPTTGLHFEDVRRLLEVLHGFVDAGNSVIVIEHNLDVLKTADWIIDLGPEGGEAGGHIVAEGTPEHVAKIAQSHTGVALRSVLGSRPRGSSRAMANGQTRAARNAPLADRDVIRVVGAREHNLKDVTVDIARNAMTVCSGVSGSGKSSLAMDTIYVEGQRRYVESLSAYARQFLGQFQKPKVEHVYGLSPAIAIEQKAASKSPRSTVGTVTEIYDYMRVLWARLGQGYCPACQKPIGTLSSDEIVEAVLQLPDGTRALLCAPVERGDAESWDALLARCRANGYVRVRLDGEVVALDQPVHIDAGRKHSFEVVIDRLIIRAKDRRRIADSIEHALSVGNGIVILAPAAERDDSIGVALRAPRRFSQHFSCEHCGRSFEELSPHHFSFNSKLGWCPTCEGLGVQRGASTASVAVRPDRSILDGAIAGWERARSEPMLGALLAALAKHIGFDATAKWNDLAEDQHHAILFGTGNAWIGVEIPRPESPSSIRASAPVAMRVQFKGFFPAIDEATRISWQHRMKLGELVTEVPCRTCGGSRLSDVPAAVRLANHTIVDVCRLPLGATLDFFEAHRGKLTSHQKSVAGELLHEIMSRLRFLVEVGLDYLSLDRAAPTLSGGESQRIQLASQIGSGLTGVLYVLDEPTIGLHPRDNRRLIKALERLRDLGNTLLLVEHDRDVIAAADHLLDFGPGAGALGGRIVASGGISDLKKSDDSLTGRYLSNAAAIAVPLNRRQVSLQVQERSRRSETRAAPCETLEWLEVRGARHNNLANIDVAIPLSRFVCVSGVSGSGKSSLIGDIVYPALANRIQHGQLAVGAHAELRGIDRIDKVINVDQTPIGNSPLSNPSTYTGAFDLIRELFARLPESKVRGYSANRFSFNRPGGRCEQCEGLGQVCHEMHFLPDVWVTCDTCRGLRYNTETLEVRFKGKSIADILSMRVADALEHFANVARLKRLLQTLADVGLGYVELGQAANTLSGGEAQRVKLAAELGKPQTGRTIYFLDEPTTGLHFDDVRKLLEVLHRLVDLGNSVVCIEHNLDVLKSADWIIDLGPEAGPTGGRIVAAGSPERVASSKGSHTGRALAEVLRSSPKAERVVASSDATPAPSAREAPLRVPDADESVKMPWQRNGRGWHTRDRVSRRGEKIEWSGAALEFVIDEVEKLGGEALAPTDWNDRARVEVTAKPPTNVVAASVPWFLHALTGARWLLDLNFRVPRRTFAEGELNRKLGLKTLDDRNDLPIYGNEPRVKIRPHPGDTDRIRILIHDEAEVASKGFRDFLKTATRCYLTFVRSLARDVARAQPWRVDGKAWHLSQKSLSPTQPPQWNPMTLVELIGRMSRVRTDLTADWARKSAVCLVDRSGATVARIGTNARHGIQVDVSVPCGVISAAKIEKLGLTPRIERGRPIDRVQFLVQSLDQVAGDALSAVLKSAVAAAEAD